MGPSTSWCHQGPGLAPTTAELTAAAFEALRTTPAVRCGTSEGAAEHECSRRATHAVNWPCGSAETCLLWGMVSGNTEVIPDYSNGHSSNTSRGFIGMKSTRARATTTLSYIHDTPDGGEQSAAPSHPPFLGREAMCGTAARAGQRRECLGRRGRSHGGLGLRTRRRAPCTNLLISHVLYNL